MEKIKKYGLIGFPLSHSFSPRYFTEKFNKENIVNTEYKSYPLGKIEAVCSLIDSGMCGLNVTIPYKEAVVDYLDKLSPECKEIQAVNTIKISNGQTEGFNTDVIGFESTLIELLDGTRVDKALVLGSGGAAKAVVYVLRKLQIKYTIVSRREGFMQYGDLNKGIISSHKLIINTTPLGMVPDVEMSPDIPYDLLTKEHFLYDLIYNPEKTIFLKYGEQAGASIKNGYDMLVAQAEASWTIWNQQ